MHKNSSFSTLVPVLSPILIWFQICKNNNLLDNLKISPKGIKKKKKSCFSLKLLTLLIFNSGFSKARFALGLFRLAGPCRHWRWAAAPHSQPVPGGGLSVESDPVCVAGILQERKQEEWGRGSVLAIVLACRSVPYKSVRSGLEGGLFLTSASSAHTSPLHVECLFASRTCCTQVFHCVLWVMLSCQVTKSIRNLGNNAQSCSTLRDKIGIDILKGWE